MQLRYSILEVNYEVLPLFFLAIVSLHVNAYWKRFKTAYQIPTLEKMIG